MGSSQVRVGVLIPAFNDQKGLDATLECLGREEIPCMIYVVDDGSVPAMTCPEFCGPHRVCLTALPENSGIEHALNTGLAEIMQNVHEYIARLDCGDLPMPGRIESQVRELDAHPDIGILGTWAKCVDDDGRYLYTLRFPIDHATMIRKQRYVPAMLHPSVMIRTSALEKVGLYSDKYRTAEDFDLFVRISRCFRIANIPEVLTEYIVSPKGTTSSKRRKNLVSRLGVQLAYFGYGDPHSYLGVARTLLFMVLPFSWLSAVKRRLWQ